MAKRPEKTDQTKRDLQDAFWILFEKAARAASTKPAIETITIQQIVDKAGYNRATFYLHYKDIYELLDEVEGAVLQDMVECVKGCLVKLHENSSTASCLIELAKVVKYYELNKRQIVTFLGYQGDPNFIFKLRDELKPAWREYIVTDEDRKERSDGELELIFEYTLSGTLFMISQWLKDPGDVSASQMGHLVYDFAIKDITLRTRD